MLLVGPGTIISPLDHLFIENGGIVIEKDRILAVGKYENLKESFHTSSHLEAFDGIILPGLICAHGHFYGTFARGISLGGHAPKSFLEILENLWWRVDKVLSLEDIEVSALIGAMAAARVGTTTVFDHHASPFAARGSLAAITDATRSVGIRCCASFEVSDRNGTDLAEEAIRENVNFIQTKADGKDPYTAGCFGLHASFTLSDATLQACGEASRDLNTGYHVHVAEGDIDTKKAQEYGFSGAFSRLIHYGLLNYKSLAVHGVYINEKEYNDLLNSKSWVIHCPESNMNNAVGVAPFLKLGEMGVQRALGTDGYTYDMFREMKVAYLVHKLNQRDPRVLGADELSFIQFRDNAKLAQLYFEEGLGSLSTGSPADLVILDYHAPTPVTKANFPWHLHFGIDATMVRHTLVNGKIVVRNREIKTTDEREIASRARELCSTFWDRIAETPI